MTDRWSAHRLPRVRRQMVRTHLDAADAVPDLRQRAVRAGTPPPADDHQQWLRHAAADLGAADLFWVTRPMAGVALQASASLPSWTPVSAQPAPRGLLVWDGGLPHLAWRGAPKAAWTTSALGVHLPPTVAVDGIAWAPGPGGVRLDLLTRTAALPGGWLAPRWAAAELFAFGSVDLSLRDPVPTTSQDWSSGLVAAVGATWLLMMQPSVADTRPPRRDIDPGQVRSRREADVSIIDLRQQARAAADDRVQRPGRVHQHRWLVRGYWRQQACGPGRALRRPVFVAPHVKGPEGSPMVERVWVWRR